MRGNASHLARDLISLVELQTELFAADLGQSKRRLLVPLGLLLAGSVLLLACFPVALIGLALWLESLGLRPVAAYLSAAGLGAAVTILLLAAGWKLLCRTLRVFQCSKDELIDNLQAIKTMLTSRS